MCAQEGITDTLHTTLTEAHMLTRQWDIFRLVTWKEKATWIHWHIVWYTHNITYLVKDQDVPTLRGFATNITCVIAAGGRIGLYGAKSEADGGCSFTFMIWSVQDTLI